MKIQFNSSLGQFALSLPDDDSGESVLGKQTIAPKLAFSNPAVVFGIRLRLLWTGLQQLVWVVAVAVAFAAAGASDVAAFNTGCVDGNCPDVPADGISYTSGIDTVNVGDGLPGVSNVNNGVIGIELRQSGVNGTGSVEIRYYIVPHDIDNDSNTPPVNVVSDDNVNPLEVEGDFIIDNGDETYTIGETDYDGKQLAVFLEVNGDTPGGIVSGSLTVNNPGPNPGPGAGFITTNADGLHVESKGGNAGPAGWFTILLASWGFDGKNGGNAGSVAVNNNALITVTGTEEGHHGISAISQGGRGGKGGYAGVAALSYPGEGGNGGKGGDVSVMLGTESNITTHGLGSHGVLAKSQGGDGGAAGDADGIAAFGETGGNGGDAGNVEVNNAGRIMTLGENSNGIYAKSVGAGAGSGSDASGAYAEGGNGGGESYGAMVTVNNSGTITTDKSDSFGILAQSIGGGGGDGGGAGGWFTVGGLGGSGGGSGIVTVNDSGTVETNGDRSTAIFVQSIGGGGGNGGDAISVIPTLSVAVGGDGGLGGDGDNAVVSTEGSDIDTSGSESHGIHAQSIGGGGGNGGLAVSGSLGSSPVDISIAIGGNGGGGGDAGEIVRVNTSIDTTIDTMGISSHGIAAQSIGGGGGNGGTALSGSGGPGLKVSVSIGGSGAMAGDGKIVDINNAAAITTGGDLSAGIFTQSIGGGGGNGGFAGSVAVGGASASVSLGGDGAAGGIGGTIDIDNFGKIETGGNGAAGIFAQSIGGGGGNGGSALAGSIGLASVSTTVGGKGGEGNDGGLVDILNAGLINTLGHNSAGVFAQSIGGGGGNGGDATSLSLAGPVAVAVGVGGDGGNGGNGGNVIVENEGKIETQGVTSDGVFAQSIGGSGGSGGSATTGTLVFPIEIEGVEIPAISANVAVGGNGAGGGTAGKVEATNSGQITTTDFMSNGIFAQSVGGSGGKGGHATNISLAFDATFTGKVAVGGSGGFGGIGDEVTVNNFGQIHTMSGFSNGVFAQSVGGGGGTGGNSTNVSLSLTPPPTAPEDFIPTPSVDFDLAIGGNGGTGAFARAVEVTNEGTIITEGHFAAGVMAQSVGGSGGSGGDARVISVELTADPMDFVPLTDLTSLDMSLVFGGTGGDGGNGGNVTVTNTSDLETIGIHTSGAFSHGIVAQSVGGGGGFGGSAMTFEFSNADLMPEIPVLDDISGLTSIEMTLQGSGGAGGNGENVALISEGNIRTEGDFAMGVVGQSVGGGGGLAGFFNPHGITSNEIVNAVFNAVIDTDAGLSFSGSVGGAGTAGNVTVNHTGNIETKGDGAHGLFAQSTAAQGAAGNVNIDLTGSICALGEDASGIFAHSSGGAGNGNITINLNTIEGVVQGGSGSGAGVHMLGGATNTLNNSGMITTLSSVDGNAVIGTTGYETINNSGTIIGSVNLGTGTNVFKNNGIGRLDSGSTLYLGGGNLLTNEGTLSPGGSGNVFTTDLTGNFVQTSSGIISVDMDSSNGTADRFNASGTADLAGVADLNIVKAGRAAPGAHQTTIFTATGGATNSGLSLTYQPTAVMDYKLLYPNSTDVVLSTSIDFSPDQGLNRNQRAIGEAVNTIQRAGGTESISPVVAELFTLPDRKGLGNAYDQLSPVSYNNSTRTSLDSSRYYSKTVQNRMASLRAVAEPVRVSGENPAGQKKNVLLAYNGADADIGKLLSREEQTESGRRYGVWASGFGQWGKQDTADGFVGYDFSVSGLALGFDYNFSKGLIAGFSLGGSSSDVDLKQNAGSGDIDSYLGSLYASFFTNNLYLESIFTYGRLDYDNKRNIVVGNLRNAASSDHNGDLFNAYLSGGYYFGNQGLRVGPFASLQYTYLDEGGFEETGAGGMNLVVDDRQTDALVSHLGMRVGGFLDTNIGRLIPEVSLAWLYDFGLDDQAVNASFAGSPGGSFSVEGQDAENNGIALGAGLSLLPKSGIVISLGYRGELRDNFSSHAAIGQIRFEF